MNDIERDTSGPNWLRQHRISSSSNREHCLPALRTYLWHSERHQLRSYEPATSVHPSLQSEAQDASPNNPPPNPPNTLYIPLNTFMHSTRHLANDPTTLNRIMAAVHETTRDHRAIDRIQVTRIRAKTRHEGAVVGQEVVRRL